MSNLEAMALLYIAIPNAIFLSGWIVTPIGPAAATMLLAAVVWILVREAPETGQPTGVQWVLVLVVASLWCLAAGIGHFTYANSDWWVRDAVLLDLVRDPWPVVYRIDGADMLLRAPVGFYLPAAIVGKVLGVRAAELTMLAWTAMGVSLVFALMLRDRPTLRAACIRLAIFVFFSGMDIVPTLVRRYPHELGAMIEWWARIFQYSSQTTVLFWVPNHGLPGWVAIAWLLSRERRRLSIRCAVLFVVFAPIWSPVTALGIAPIAAVAILSRLREERSWASIRDLFDFRVVVPAALCVALVFPYLVAGSEKLDSGFNSDIPWIGEDIVPRYIEFVLVEFAGFAVLLFIRQFRDPLLWIAIALLLVLPIYHFGPYNDLAMRTSIPPLTFLAIRMGSWLSTPLSVTKDPNARTFAIVLLLVGAVTPFMEIARALGNPPWPMNVHSSLIDITHGAHYLTPIHQPWLERFMRMPVVP